MKRLIVVVLVFLACGKNAEVTKYGAEFYPPQGKVLHFTAQTRDYFDEYSENVSSYGEECGLPAGMVFNTDLFLRARTSRSVRMGTIEELQHLLIKYDTIVLQLVLWVDNSQLSGIGEGKFDDQIKKLAGYIKSYNRPVYLSIGSEVNNPFYTINPEYYPSAYRHIVDIFEGENVENVSYVWHVIGMKPGYLNRDPMDWYPGDTYVNWIGISIFKLTEEHYPDEDYFSGHTRDRILEIAREKDLPIMICESGTVGVKKYHSKTGQEYWDFWYEPFFEFIEQNPEVKAFNNFNDDWQDSVILDNWRTEMQKHRYLHSSDTLFDLVGYEK